MWLKNGAHVVTANKRALSNSLELYNSIYSAMRSYTYIHTYIHTIYTYKVVNISHVIMLAAFRNGFQIK